jgi:hypothetical protein
MVRREHLREGRDKLEACEKVAEFIRDTPSRCESIIQRLSASLKFVARIIDGNVAIE